MAAPRLVNSIIPAWYDGMGGQCQSAWSVANQTHEPLGPYQSLIDAAADLSHCGLKGVTYQQQLIAVDGPTTGVYSTVRDQVVFQFESQNYTKLVAIPAPVSDIFESDDVTVDLSNSLVVAFTGQVMAVLGDSYGGSWTVCRKGWRRRVRIGGA